MKQGLQRSMEEFKQKKKQDDEEFSLRKQIQQQNLAAGLREGQDADARSAAMRDATQIQVPATEDTGPASMQTVPLNAQRLRDALAKHGGGGKEGLRFLIDSDNIDTPLSFEEDPMSGTRFARHRNTVLPSGVNPQRAGNAVDIKSSSGEVIGVGLPGRSGITPLQTGQVKDKDRYARLTKQLTSLIRSESDAFREESKAEYRKQISKVEQELDGLEGGGAPAFDQELSLAQDALKQGAPREKVAARFKQRTGRDLP